MIRAGNVNIPIVGEVATSELKEWQGKGGKNNPFYTFLGVITGVKGFQQRNARANMPKEAGKQQRFLHNFMSTTMADDIRKPVSTLRSITADQSSAGGQGLNKFFKSANDVLDESEEQIKKQFGTNGNLTDDEVKAYQAAIKKVKGELDPFKQSVEYLQSDANRNQGGNVINMLSVQDKSRKEAGTVLTNIQNARNATGTLTPEQTIWRRLSDQAEKEGIISQTVNQANKPAILETMQQQANNSDFNRQVGDALQKLQNAAKGQGTISQLANKPNQDLYNKMTWNQFNSSMQKYEQEQSSKVKSTVNNIADYIAKNGADLSGFDFGDVDESVKQKFKTGVSDISTKWNQFTGKLKERDTTTNQFKIDSVDDFNKLWKSTFGVDQTLNKTVAKQGDINNMSDLYSYMYNKLFTDNGGQMVRTRTYNIMNNNGVLQQQTRVMLPDTASDTLQGFGRSVVKNDFDQFGKQIEQTLGYTGLEKVKYNALAYGNLAIPVGIAGAITTTAMQSNQGIHKTAYDEFQLGKIYTNQRGY